MIISIASGKGGTGKTTIEACLASVISDSIYIDCDVDAANLHLVLKPVIVNSYEFMGGKKARIETDRCQECGLCGSVCRFNAILNYRVDLLSCEGCGFCFRICQTKAVSFNSTKSGTYFECDLPDKSKFYYARLSPGEGNSGKLVSELKRKALENISPDIEWVIVDGPPGIGCPVNASISDSDYVVVVTEPTLSGVHDLKRLVQLLDTFKMKAGIVINKFDLNKTISSNIINYAESQKLSIIGLIPFSKTFVDALIEGKNVVDINENIRNELLVIWQKLKIMC